MADAGGTAAAAAGEAFWTACPHCCHVHSYPRPYLGLRLRCPVPACRRAFPASELPAAPPVVPGADMYFCTWAFFPLGPPATADGWVPFTPFHHFNPPPSPSPAPAPNPAAASADTPSRPTSRRKVGVCLKGRARAEAEEEEEATAAAISFEAEAGGFGERYDSGIDINETVDLSDLGFRIDEMGVLHDLP
ncbi:atherin-like [Panicum miliaceum]|uniref:Atherin-like n=1 Tax=Panicum miliaceum TaxID=4540 RepID=A0A3L6PBM0_PANMI|nr:atherin-like [Panicum miliaceum]